MLKETAGQIGTNLGDIAPYWFALKRSNAYNLLNYLNNLILRRRPPSETRLYGGEGGIRTLEGLFKPLLP